MNSMELLLNTIRSTPCVDESVKKRGAFLHSQMFGMGKMFASIFGGFR